MADDILSSPVLFPHTIRFAWIARQVSQNQSSFEILKALYSSFSIKRQGACSQEWHLSQFNPLSSKETVTLQIWHSDSGSLLLLLVDDCSLSWVASSWKLWVFVMSEVFWRSDICLALSISPSILAVPWHELQYHVSLSIGALFPRQVGWYMCLHWSHLIYCKVLKWVLLHKLNKAVFVHKNLYLHTCFHF